MKRIRTLYPAALIVLLSLFAAGCGGRQNPVGPNAGPRDGFFAGIWDGFTVSLVFLYNSMRTIQYQYYYHANTGQYPLGYVVGVVLSILAVLGVWGLVLDAWRAVRGR